MGHSWWAYLVLEGQQLRVARAQVALLRVTMLGVVFGGPGGMVAGLGPLHLLLWVAVASLAVSERGINLA